jgi:uncharacterized protein YjbI with pentapeptide repeats
MLPLLAFLASASAQLALASPHALPSTTAADPAAVASIRAGHHDCPHCNLAGADLTNTCVKQGDVRGANFDGARLVLMCMSYADFRGASFRHADLGGANLAHAKLDNADFTGADLSITSIRGTDLSRARGLTQRQLDAACADAGTRVPAGLKAKTCS